MNNIIKEQFYLFGLLKIAYIDFENSYISSKGEVVLRLDLTRLDDIEDYREDDESLEEVVTTIVETGAMYDAVFNGIEDIGQEILMPQINDEYYIYINMNTGDSDEVIDNTFQMSIAIKRNGELSIGESGYFNKLLDKTKGTAEYYNYKCSLNEFEADIAKWLCGCISDKLLSSQDIEGVFKNDYVEYDTYFQNRVCDNNNIFYVIHSWWTHMATNKKIKWASLEANNTKTLIAIKDD